MNTRLVGLFSAISLLIAGTTVTAFAQQRSTVGVSASAGYAFGIGSRYVGTSNRKNPDKDHYLNMGSGLQLRVGGAYKLMERVYVKSGFIYTAGVPAVTVHTEESFVLGGTANRSVTYEHSRFGIPVYVQTYITFLDLIDIYTQIGCGITFNFSSRNMEQFGNNDRTDLDAEATLQEKNSISLPLYAGIGVDYPLNEFAFLVGEIGFESSNVTMYGYSVEDAKNQGALGIDTDVTEINYEKNASDRQPPRKTPASNIYIHIGTRFYVY